MVCLFKEVENKILQFFEIKVFNPKSKGDQSIISH